MTHEGGGRDSEMRRLMIQRIEVRGRPGDFSRVLLLLCVSFAAQLEDEIKLQGGQRGWRI